MQPTEKKRQYLSGVGKRKTAIARVKVFEGGSGEAIVNGLKIREYFDTAFQTENALSPLVLANLKGRIDVEAITRGGGKEAQSDAVRHGLSRALLLVSPELRGDLKRAGYLRRDARIKERKKPGLKRARRAPQWQKR
ncbi:MAG TPA: 30S ribosomal protein S9 [Candidatus Peribacter riflensis]|uniref:Small ribosomal subunit protein uS9 n=1 Tax=Candidatus Peribacter riflensis TaxID=1735162 RepID=A0A0S1SLV0_9BACT|nr:MAG: small subunit ribosomal protein S9 [Candidatus Peribacter riflensis]OGJ78147.1 MAG: 30S ribosomal protein S9 [Candidatus Peribacteria bacterium RIFOXYB1_FULL_57_12]OGJ82940.1 MAG: 30S ribosomal protein S9 [Candidatus Peribacteria bacterium RIFOXYC1_FULL_58_8]ALM10538.1 MAG: small subunit ribosomal protein S9 [Candidatus Peribacter riflensis]ALM11641.1 MAG: small subunit ribosomal protein S9 [Candidatus Peribacter riflensis]